MVYYDIHKHIHRLLVASTEGRIPAGTITKVCLLLALLFPGLGLSACDRLGPGNVLASAYASAGTSDYRGGGRELTATYMISSTGMSPHHIWATGARVQAGTYHAKIYAGRVAWVVSDLDGKLLWSWFSRHGQITAVSCSQNGSVLAVEVDNNHVMIVGKARRDVIASARGSILWNYNVCDADFSSSGDRFLFHATTPNGLMLWLDAGHSHFIALTPSSSFGYGCAALSPDGRLIAMCYYPDYATMWRVGPLGDVHKNVDVLGAMPANTVFNLQTSSLRFSQDGSELLIGNTYGIAVWNLRTRQVSRPRPYIKNMM
jgi:WD40 repeat protein